MTYPYKNIYPYNNNPTKNGCFVSTIGKAVVVETASISHKYFKAEAVVEARVALEQFFCFLFIGEGVFNPDNRMEEWRGRRNGGEGGMVGGN